MISVHFQGKTFSFTVIQIYAPITNAEEAEVEWVYEDLQDLLELTSKKDVLFITGWDIDLDYNGIEWFALEMNRDHSIIFEIGPKYCILYPFFLTMRATPFLLRDSCLQ